ncbi:MAG: hypothetical protein IJ601_10675 [Acidaminococcaceae bacterium]|nr:hypothetical protein [Acidaminococcaceae bacterium]
MKKTNFRKVFFMAMVMMMVPCAAFASATSLSVGGSTMNAASIQWPWMATLTSLALNIIGPLSIVCALCGVFVTVGGALMGYGRQGIGAGIGFLIGFAVLRYSPDILDAIGGATEGLSILGL